MRVIEDDLQAEWTYQDDGHETETSISQQTTEDSIFPLLAEYRFSSTATSPDEYVKMAVLCDI